MENTKIQANNSDFLSELESLIEVPVVDKSTEDIFSDNEEIRVLPSEGVTTGDIITELQAENIFQGESEINIFSEENISTEIVKTEEIKKSDITESINKKSKSKILSGLFFGIRYLITTSLIFGILLVSTNFTAYYNITMSFVNASDLEGQSQGLISSVEVATIKNKVKEEIIQQKTFIQEDTQEIRSKNSIKNLLAVSDKNGVGINIEITPYQNRLIIPSIGKNIPMIDIKNRAIDNSKELNNIFMKELEDGVVRYPGSAKPGEIGNAFVFGHSSNFPWVKGDYNDVFALIDNVIYDDKIIVYYNQKKYTYIVREKKIITPGEVGILKRNKNKAELTLMACWPIGTTLNRIIVVAELVEETNEVVEKTENISSDTV